MVGLAFARLGLYLQACVSICISGFVLAGLGLDLQVWGLYLQGGSSICRPGLVLEALSLYLQVWAWICKFGLVFVFEWQGVYLQNLACI